MSRPNPMEIVRYHFRELDNRGNGRHVALRVGTGRKFQHLIMMDSAPLTILALPKEDPIEVLDYKSEALARAVDRFRRLAQEHGCTKRVADLLEVERPAILVEDAPATADIDEPPAWPPAPVVAVQSMREKKERSMSTKKPAAKRAGPKKAPKKTPKKEAAPKAKRAPRSETANGLARQSVAEAIAEWMKAAGKTLATISGKEGRECRDAVAAKLEPAGIGARTVRNHFFALRLEARG